MKLKAIMIVLFFSIVVAGCITSKWTGFVYPNKHNLTNDINIGTYSSLQDCRTAAKNHIKINGYQNADYECGLNCNLKTEKPFVCTKTER